MDFEMSTDKAYFHDGVPTKKLEFNSKEEVTKNLGSLGRHMKVFICYAPSVSSKETKGKLESRIYTFARHLITYGFDVRVDLFASSTVRIDWASWTDCEMSQADWIIFVNSKSSYELLCHPSGPKEVNIEVNAPYATNFSNSEATKKIRFSGRALYNRLYHDTTLKIIPVVLLEEDNKNEYILPILRDVNSVLHIYEDVPFDYDKLEGHFERLVCRMAGINRMAINSRGVEQKFIKLQSKIPQRYPLQSQNQVAEQEVISQVPKYSPNRQISSLNDMSEAHSFQALPHHCYYSTHSHEMVHSSLNTIAQESYNPPMISSVHQLQPQFRQYSQYSKYSHGSNQCTTNIKILQPTIMHGSVVTPKLATHIPAPCKAPSDDLPSHKIPVDSPILWQLSQDVREWKFLARFLDLDEEVIEEIDQYTRPNKTRDKSLKMLTEWVNTSSEATWRALGEAIQDAENTLLYEKLVELIKSYSV